MKWHLLNEESLEYRDFVIDSWALPDRRKTVRKKFGVLMCGGKKIPWIVTRTRWGTKETYEEDTRFLIMTKDKINVMQNNVCAYCRKYVLKQQGRETEVLA